MKLRLPDIDFRPRATEYAPRPPALAGLRVGFFDGWGDQGSHGEVRMYPVLAEIRENLVQRYGVSETVWQVKPSISAPVPPEMLRDFSERVDVVVNGEGLWGSCTAASVLDAIQLEALGKPTITVVQDRFASAARMHAEAGGLPQIPLLIQPAAAGGTSIDHDVRDLVEREMQRVLAALTRPVDEAANGAV